MKKKNPSDYSKLYDFYIGPEKLQMLEKKMSSLILKHFRNAFIFGFCVELMMVRTRICKFIFLMKGKLSQ